MESLSTKYGSINSVQPTGAAKCPVLAIANHKGGVGKTTTSAHLAHAYAMSGKRVLVIDADPQGNLTECLGVSPSGVGVQLADLISERTMDAGAASIEVRPNLWLIPSNQKLAALERMLPSITNGELRLRSRMPELQARYDLIIVDCCPGLGALLNSVFNAATHVLIPIDSSYLGYTGLRALFAEIEEIRQSVNPALTIAGYLLTRSDRTLLTRETIQTLRSQFGERVLQTQIPTAVALREAPLYGQTLFEYAPEHLAAVAYLDLATELLGLIGLGAHGEKAEVARA